MSKRETWRKRLAPALSDPERLEALLLDGSGLPGPRPSLDVGQALADAVEEAGAGGALLRCLLPWATLAPEDAPPNDRLEFLPFAALQALGCLYRKASPADRQRFLAALLAAAGDERGRVRDGAALGLQRLGERDPAELRRLVAENLKEASPFQRQTLLTALAHPPLLATEEQAAFALEAAGEALRAMREQSDTGRAGGSPVPEKALAAALSVVVEAAPGAGFAFLREWASKEDPGARRIVALTIRKSRLARSFPDKVEEVGAVLSWGW